MRITHALVLWNALVALAGFQELTRGTFPVGVLHPRQERVWIVDAGGGGDFTELQPAIDAARSGDVLLLRSDVPANPVGEFVVEGKGLSIIGEGVRRRIGSGVPGIVFGDPGDGCKNAIIVRDVPGGEEVVLRNLSLEAFCKSPFGFGWPGLAAVVRLEESAGSIWVEDCRVVILPGTDWALTGYPTRISGIDIRDCASATLVRTTVSGPPGILCCAEGLSQSQALRITGSTVNAFECEFIGRIGGEAWQANFTPDAEGDDAVRIEGSFLFASQCRFEGGRGGRTQYPCGTVPGADGGAGARIDGTSEVHALSCLCLRRRGRRERYSYFRLPGGAAWRGSGGRARRHPRRDDRSVTYVLDLLSGRGRELGDPRCQRASRRPGPQPDRERARRRVPALAPGRPARRSALPDRRRGHDSRRRRARQERDAAVGSAARVLRGELPAGLLPGARWERLPRQRFGAADPGAVGRSCRSAAAPAVASWPIQAALRELDARGSPRLRERHRIHL